MAQASLAKQQQEIDEQQYTLKYKSACRTTGLCLIPDADSKLYSIVQVIREQYDRGYHGVMPHIHLIFPFLPKDSFAVVGSMIKQCIADIAPFEISFNDIVRTHGTGKQYCYLICNSESKRKLVSLQARIMNLLCGALNNGTPQPAASPEHTQKKRKKKGKRKPQASESKSNTAHKTCLEHEKRNVDFNPHLTIGIVHEKEFTLVRKMIFSALQENELESAQESKTDHGSDDEDHELMARVLRFKVSNLYMINAKSGSYRVIKTIPLGT